MSLGRYLFIVVFGVLFGCGMTGFCFLLIDDEFKKARASHSRLRLWFAYTMSVLAVMILVIGTIRIGMRLNKYTFDSELKSFVISNH